MYKFLKSNNQQMLRFFVSGIIASIFNFISYKTLYLVTKNLLFASIFGYSVGIIISFIFAKLWVFKNSASQPIVRSFSLFCLIYLLGGIENYKIAWLFGALIGSLNNYLGSKYLSFNK